VCPEFLLYGSARGTEKKKKENIFMYVHECMSSASVVYMEYSAVYAKSLLYGSARGTGK